MMIIGCDFHPSFQQITYVDQETGECGDRRLSHREEAVGFYGSLAGRKVVVGLEATGNDRWFTNDARSGPGPLHRYVPSGPRLRCFWAIVPFDAGRDYGETKIAAHITTESPAHIDRNTQR